MCWPFSLLASSHACKVSTFLTVMNFCAELCVWVVTHSTADQLLDHDS